MALRGAAGRNCHTLGSVGLAHLLLDAGVENSGLGPWRLRENGPVLTGDISILNTESLFSNGMRGGQAQAVLMAYDRWGTDALDKLEGEFAFVLWDPQKKLLWAARDRFGVRPLAYRTSDRMLLIASDSAALVEPEDQPSEIWIAQYLSGQECDDALTAYDGIYRLPPGHMLCSTETGMSVHKWWTLEPEEVSPAKAPELLAERLSLAVEQRMPSNAATFLSGGLDSSTLTCLAAQGSAQTVRAFSMRYPDMPSLDEGEFIDMVRSDQRVKGHDIFPKQGLALCNPDRMLSEQGNPVQGFNLATMRQALSHIAALDVRVVIDGHGGDEVIGTGEWHYDELACAGKWLPLARGLKAWSGFSGESSFAAQMGMYLSAYGNRLSRKLANFLPSEDPGDPFAWRDILNEDLVARVDLVSRVRTSHSSAHATLPASMRAHAVAIYNPATATGFEVLNKAGASQGLAHRFPFYDRHVVALCLGQPSATKIANGRPRALLREAMKGILPEPIRLRPDKTDFADEVLMGLRADEDGRIASYAQKMPAHLASYVDAPSLKRNVEVLFGSDKAQHAQAIIRVWRVFWLDQWLSRHAQLNRFDTVGEGEEHALSL